VTAAVVVPQSCPELYQATDLAVEESNPSRRVSSLPSSLAGLRPGTGRAPLGGSTAPRTTPHHFASDARARAAKTQVRMALTPNPLIRMGSVLGVTPRGEERWRLRAVPFAVASSISLRTRRLRRSLCVAAVGGEPRVIRFHHLKNGLPPVARRAYAALNLEPAATAVDDQAPLSQPVEPLG